nr:zinc finger, CCHC-type, Gag-polypeptide of LTR copia-type [Tanacetum cinerariifolium]
FVTLFVTHELFLQTVNGSSVQPVAFNTSTTRASTRQQTEHSSSRGRGRNNYSNRGVSSRSRGRGYRRLPQCQVCGKEGHCKKRPKISRAQMILYKDLDEMKGFDDDVGLLTKVTQEAQA